MMNNIKNINEFNYSNQMNEPLLELAQMTKENDFFRQKYGKIFIKGGGDNNAGQKEHNPPHFHLEFNDGKDIRVIIPNNINDDIKSIDDTLNNKIKKDIKKWFLLPYKFTKLHNNYEMLKIEWNTLNYEDENISKFEIE